MSRREAVERAIRFSERNRLGVVTIELSVAQEISRALAALEREGAEVHRAWQRVGFAGVVAALEWIEHHEPGGIAIVARALSATDTAPPASEATRA